MVLMGIAVVIAVGLVAIVLGEFFEFIEDAIR